MTSPKPEILAPAGDLTRLKIAFTYGADAVYLGGKGFSLRAGATNFSHDDLQSGVSYAHALGKKLYLALNIFAHDRDLDSLADELLFAQKVGVDALIISDPGVFDLARELTPTMPIHISTQSNNTNRRSARFWKGQGAQRIILARELSLAEAADIAAFGGLATEIFVHGAICISYSGRCLLSSFLTGRHANYGDCSHPCRWQYELHEARRPNAPLPIEEDEHGTYIMNSNDLCLLPVLPQLLATGAAAWKIEGRNKSAYFVANATRVYRQALDALWQEKDGFYLRKSWQDELNALSNRGYTTAFAVGAPDGSAYSYDTAETLRDYDFAGIVWGVKDGLLQVEQRNHLAVGDRIEILLPDCRNLDMTLDAIYDDEGRRISAAPHPGQQIAIPCDRQLPVPAVIRRKVK